MPHRTAPSARLADLELPSMTEDPATWARAFFGLLEDAAETVKT